MAENNVDPENEWSNRASDTAEDTLVAMETLLATLRAFEDVLRQQDISIASSAEYCDNFCQVMCTCYLKATPRLIALAHPRFVFIFVHLSLYCGSDAGSLAAWKYAGFLDKQGAQYHCVCYCSYARLHVISQQNNLPVKNSWHCGKTMHAASGYL